MLLDTYGPSPYLWAILAITASILFLSVTVKRHQAKAALTVPMSTVPPPAPGHVSVSKILIHPIKVCGLSRPQKRRFEFSRQLSTNYVTRLLWLYKRFR
jgi:hypothetical protein